MAPIIYSHCRCRSIFNQAKKYGGSEAKMTHQELSYNAFAEESLILYQSNYLFPRPLIAPKPLSNALMTPSNVARTGLLFNKGGGQTDSDLIKECLLIINTLLPK